MKFIDKTDKEIEIDREKQVSKVEKKRISMRRSSSVVNQLQIQRQLAFNEIYGVNTLVEILGLFCKDLDMLNDIYPNTLPIDYSREVIRIKDKYIFAISYLYSLDTIKVNTAKFKKEIKEHKVKDLGDIFFIAGVHKAVIKKATKKLDKKLETETVLLFDVREEIKRVLSHLSKRGTFPNYISLSNNQTYEMVEAYHIAYMLMLSSGLRFSEIFKTAKIFTNNNKLLVSGIVKKGKVENYVDEQTIIHLSKDTFNYYLKKLRKYIDFRIRNNSNKNDISLDDIKLARLNTLFGKTFNNNFRLINKNINNPHQLRKYYALTLLDEYKKTHKEAFDSFANSDGDAENTIIVNFMDRVLHHAKPQSSGTNYLAF